MMVNSTHYTGLTIAGRLVIEDAAEKRETIAVEVFWNTRFVGNAVTCRRAGKMVRLLKWDRPGASEKIRELAEASRVDIEEEIIRLSAYAVPQL